MVFLDFESRPSRAFVHGLFKGLAAPVMLFSRDPLPPLPPVIEVKAPSYPLHQASELDWAKIAGDFRAAIGKHEQR